MTTPAEFRAYARECLQWAAEATDDAARQTLLETAKFWTHAALKLDGLRFVEFPDGASAGATSRDEAHNASEA